MKCQTCEKPLTGRQKKFCSRECKNRSTNQLHQQYECQQRRGKERKLKLISMSGGKCSRCCYNKNSAALEFHHSNPAEKAFQLDLRSLSNRRWELIEEEWKKCELLCSNCHAELHNPDAALENGTGLPITLVFI